ncbi:hypothetical protein MBLNU230_g8200t1 [Neophaeotheca triangularis]
MPPPSSSTYTTLSASPDPLPIARRNNTKSSSASSTSASASASASTSATPDGCHVSGIDTSASSSSNTRSALGHSSKRKPRKINTNMTSLAAAAPSRSTSGRAKLHKRAASGSSMPPSPSVFAGRPTPYATYEDQPFPDLPDPHSTSSTDKIKPYLRKISNPKEKEDQGQIDLSMSTAENERLAGLGIQDFGASQSPLDISFINTSRRSHTRTTSVGSNTSNSFRPTQPFVHPMRQTPRPYTPPTGTSYTSSFTSLNPHNYDTNENYDSETAESSDVVDSDFNPTNRRRSTSSTNYNAISSYIPPTPLSQTHTLEALGDIPKLTTSLTRNNTTPPTTTPASLTTTSASNSSHKPRAPRTSTSTSISTPTPTPHATRSSLDKARHLLSHHHKDPNNNTTHFPHRHRRSSDLCHDGGKSSSETTSREERIRAARRKFEAKEAGKAQKVLERERKERDVESARGWKGARARARRGRSSVEVGEFGGTEEGEGRKEGSWSDGGRESEGATGGGDTAAFPAFAEDGGVGGAGDGWLDGRNGGRSRSDGALTAAAAVDAEKAAYRDRDCYHYDNNNNNNDRNRKPQQNETSADAEDVWADGDGEKFHSGSGGGGGGGAGGGDGRSGNGNGKKDGRKEKQLSRKPRREVAQSGWLRFETWVRTRLVGCGSSSSRD